MERGVSIVPRFGISLHPGTKHYRVPLNERPSDNLAMKTVKAPRSRVSDLYRREGPSPVCGGRCHVNLENGNGQRLGVELRIHIKLNLLLWQRITCNVSREHQSLLSLLLLFFLLLWTPTVDWRCRAQHLPFLLQLHSSSLGAGRRSSAQLNCPRTQLPALVRLHGSMHALYPLGFSHRVQGEGRMVSRWRLLQSREAHLKMTRQSRAGRSGLCSLESCSVSGTFWTFTSTSTTSRLHSNLCPTRSFLLIGILETVTGTASTKGQSPGFMGLQQSEKTKKKGGGMD